jgi:hypothetical protein
VVRVHYDEGIADHIGPEPCVSNGDTGLAHEGNSRTMSMHADEEFGWPHSTEEASNNAGNNLGCLQT